MWPVGEFILAHGITAAAGGRSGTELRRREGAPASRPNQTGLGSPRIGLASQSTTNIVVIKKEKEKRSLLLIAP